ncbi:MAG: hypothetical protein H0V44_01210 [Planctomycetes bacterium]|nr:hypothetical protein [Planctomycetota bacterium]
MYFLGRSQLRLARSIVVAILLAILPSAMLAAEDHAEDHAGHDHAHDEVRHAPQTPQDAIHDHGDAPPRLAGGQPIVHQVNMSLDVRTVAGASTATDTQISGLKLGAHDPKRRGFTLQEAELSLSGSVDRWLDAQAYIVSTPDGIELEEAFATTAGRPYGLRLKAGYYLADFGVINPKHPHEWLWLDQPLANGRILGPDGMRGGGAGISYLIERPWRSELQVAAHSADDPTMVSFLGREEGSAATIGGRPAIDKTTRSMADLVWVARWSNSVSSDRVRANLGMSGAIGPNATGPGGKTMLGGLDAGLTWRSSGGRPLASLQVEWIFRDFAADESIDPGDGTVVPSQTLVDQGVGIQLLVHPAPDWEVGLRWEYATARGDDYVLADPVAVVPGSFTDRGKGALRDDRMRVSPLIAWRPSEHAKLRLQYDYDRADHLAGDVAHSAWLGLEILIGAHRDH